MNQLKSMNIMCGILLSLFAISCKRAEVSTSNFTFKIDSSSGSRKVGTLATFPTSKKACFGINIIGGGIDPEPRSCAPALGRDAHRGFIESGSIDITVPKGSGRRIEIYAYMIGLNETCPSTDTQDSINPAKLYLVGAQNEVDMSADKTEIEMTVQYPGDADHVIKTLALPTSCSKNPTSSAPKFFSVSGQTVRFTALSGRNYTAMGVVGEMQTIQTTSSNGNVYKAKGVFR